MGLNFNRLHLAFTLNVPLLFQLQAKRLNQAENVAKESTFQVDDLKYKTKVIPGQKLDTFRKQTFLSYCMIWPGGLLSNRRVSMSDLSIINTLSIVAYFQGRVYFLEGSH